MAFCAPASEPSYVTSAILFFFFFRATLTACGRSQAGVELELQLPAYTAATATLDP